MDDKALEIIVRFEGLPDDSATADGSGGGDSGKLSYGEKTARSAQRTAKKLVSYGVISSTVDRFVSYNMSQVEVTTGAKEYEQRISTAYSIGKQTLDSAIMVGMGIASGNAPLAIFGLFMSGMQKVMNYSQNVSVLHKQEALENVSIGMQNVRAGTSGRRSGRS